MSLFTAPLRLTLTPYELERFKGGWSVMPDDDLRGGPARLYLALAHVLMEGCIDIEDADLVKVNRYAYAYGGGGYQNAFRAIVSAAFRAGWEPPDSVNDIRHNRSAEGRRWA